MKYCSNCGAQLNDNSNFCHICGTPVNGAQVTKSTERKEEFVGKVFKCPNCGSVITESTVVCPECGFEITGREAVSSVKSFQEELMKLESKKSGGILNKITRSSDIIDNQILTLIKNYPIPNSVADIKEFIFLSIANIDVKLSSQSIGSKFSKIMNNNDKDMMMAKKISDAWVAKMEQAYQKALVSFPNDPDFETLQNIYFDKLKELKIKIK